MHTLLENCKQWCGTDRKIKWTLTGGEPFIDPNIISVLELLYNQPYTEQINTISNGSLPLKKYLEAAKFYEQNDQPVKGAQTLAYAGNLLVNSNPELSITYFITSFVNVCILSGEIRKKCLSLEKMSTFN